MSNIINLNKARKKKNRREAVAKADENRIKFGLTKDQKKSDKSRIADFAKNIDEHKIDDEKEQVMRIVGGKFSGRKISAPSGIVSRPTTDRVRESIFNLLDSRDDVDFNAARIIDLFAGSGALGMEAMSRGADRCLFVEEDAVARGAIRENLDSLGLIGNARIHRRSATNLGDRPSSDGGPFSIAFMDPPYGKNLAPAALASLRDGDWLTSNAIIVVEQAKKETLAALHAFHEVDRRIYGDTQIGIYQFNPDPV